MSQTLAPYTASQRVRIQNHLRDVAMAGDFFAVVYDKDTGLAADIDFNATDALIVRPKTALANEISSSIAEDANMGRRVQRRRQEWMFQLHLAFDREVSLEAFEQYLMDNPPILPRTDQFSPASIYLTSCSYDHPPQQGAANGTRATLTFAVTLGRH
jgi:hypothetical protein